MEIVSLDFKNREIHRYQAISCDTALPDVVVILLFSDDNADDQQGRVGTLGHGESRYLNACNITMYPIDEPTKQCTLCIGSGKYTLTK